MNAPQGVSDYVQRYGGNMYNLAKQQADPRYYFQHVIEQFFSFFCFLSLTNFRKWGEKVTENVNKERRSLLAVDKLGERSKWRDARLMDISLLKQKWKQQGQL